MDRLPQHRSDFTERNNLWSAYLNGTPVPVEPPRPQSFESFREQWLARSGRTPQDYLAVTAQDTSSLHCVSGKGRDLIAPVPGSDSRAIGRSRDLHNDSLSRNKLPYDAPKPFTTSADRSAVLQFDRSQRLLAAAQSLQTEEDNAIRARSLQRFQDRHVQQRETSDGIKYRESENRLLRHMDRASTGGGLATSRHNAAALDLCTAATQNDPTNMTYARAKAAAELKNGNLRAAMSTAHTMNELAVFPRMHPRERIHA